MPHTVHIVEPRRVRVIQPSVEHSRALQKHTEQVRVVQQNIERVRSGQTGIAGLPVAAARYVHHQNTASTTWTINHDLGFYPDVVVLNSGSQEVICELIHVSVNTVVAQFVLPMTGLAICS